MSKEEMLSFLPEDILDKIKRFPKLTDTVENITKGLNLNGTTLWALEVADAQYAYQLLSYSLVVRKEHLECLDVGSYQISNQQTQEINKFFVGETGLSLGVWEEHRDALMKLTPDDLSGKLEKHWLASAFPTSKFEELPPALLSEFLSSANVQAALGEFERKLSEELARFFIERSPDE